jgi:diadenosine tetraphosphate (Ap4A) HIT family hydrolase
MTSSRSRPPATRRRTGSANLQVRDMGQMFAVVTFRRSGHVADPCDFTDEELPGYWADVRTVAKTIERAYLPCQLNCGTFGNAVPHIHPRALVSKRAIFLSSSIRSTPAVARGVYRQ